MEFKPNSHPAPTEHNDLNRERISQSGPFDQTPEQVQGHSTYAPHHVRGPGGFTHHSADPNQHLDGHVDQSQPNRYHGVGISQQQAHHVGDPTLDTLSADQGQSAYQGPSPVYAKNASPAASGQFQHGNQTTGTYSDYQNNADHVPHPAFYADPAQQSPYQSRRVPSGADRSGWWRVPTLLMSGAFLALVAVGFGFFLNDKTTAPTGEIPRISASLIPEREAPKDPGGMEIPNRDIHVVNTMDLSTIDSNLAILDTPDASSDSLVGSGNQPILRSSFSAQPDQSTTFGSTAQSGIRPIDLDTAFATDPFATFDSDDQKTTSRQGQSIASAPSNANGDASTFADTQQTNINELLSAEDESLLDGSTNLNPRAVGNSEANSRSINDLLLGLDEAAAWTEGRLIRRRLGLNLRRALEEEAKVEAKLENVSFQQAAARLEPSGLDETIQRAEAKALAEREARLIRQQVLLEREKNLKSAHQPSIENADNKGIHIPSFGRDTRVTPSRPIGVVQTNTEKSPRFDTAPQKTIRISLSGPMSPMAPFDLDSAFFDDTVLMQEARLSLNDIRSDAPSIDLDLSSKSISAVPQAPVLRAETNHQIRFGEEDKAKFKAKVFNLAASLESTRQNLQQHLDQNRLIADEVRTPAAVPQPKPATKQLAMRLTQPKGEPVQVKQRPLIVDASAPALVVLPSDQNAPLALANQDIDRNQESLVPLIQQQQVEIHALAGPEPQKPLVGQFAQVSDYQALDKSMLADPLIDSLNAGDGIQVAQLSLDGLDTLPILDSEAELPLMVQEVDAEIDLMNQQLNQQQEQQAFAQQQQNAAIANQQQQLAILRQQADSNGPPQDSPFGNAPIPFRPIVPAGLNGSSVGKPYAIQIASVRKRKMASMAWQRAQKKFPELLGDMVLNVETARVRGKTFYRVQAGPVYNRMTAADICDQLKGQKQDCIVAKRQ